jgi:endonuclease/exonuclease/phosphatase family metal-dependent hydrolase
MEDPQTVASLTLATFNIHMGVDGWGRPHDIVGECRALQADVYVLQESWAPDDGSPSTATRIAEGIGHRVVVEVALAHGRLYSPHPSADRKWGPRLYQSRTPLRLDGERWASAKEPADRTFQRGRWGIAVLSRVPVGDVEVIPLGQLRRDPARRAVIRVVAQLDGGPLTIHGTHMSHITHGSHAQYRLLGTHLPPVTTAAVLAGDMNLWGPPVSSYVRGWRRSVNGRTWPAPRPHSQLDHVMVTPPVTVTAARIGEYAGSDHRPVVATLSLPPAHPGPARPGEGPGR